jgi:glycosyltransferase involved in cell wall biosynthesis
LSTLIIIPAHNEEESIGNVIVALLPLQIPILIVGSACTDATIPIAQKLGCFVIESGIGYETACLSGYHWALQKGYTQVVQMDADGQHPPEYVSVLLQQAHRADWIIGSRQGTGSKIEIHQRISSWLLKQIVFLLYQYSLRDPTSGMWVLNQSVLECLCEKPSFVSMEAILRVYSHRQGFSILEVPVPMVERFHGNSMHDGFRGISNWMKAVAVLVEYRFFLFKEEKSDYRV